VAFQPALAALLRLPGLAFAVGGAVGLPLGEPLGGLGEGEPLARLRELPAVEQPAGAPAQLDQAPAGSLGRGGGLGQPCSA
jgi:hypothetical protein